MKRIAKYLFIIALLLPHLSSAQSGPYLLKGRVGQLSAPAKAYLTRYNDDGDVTDSSYIVNGAFIFKGNLKEPINAYLVINKDGTGTKGRNVNSIHIYLEPGSIKIEGADNLSNARITGSKINTDNQAFKIGLQPIMDESRSLNEAFTAAVTQKRKDEQNYASLQEKYKRLKSRREGIYANYIKTHPDAELSIFAIRELGGIVPDVTIVEPLFNGLSTSVKNSSLGRIYANDLLSWKTTAIGAAAPDFTLPDTAGKPIMLKDFRGKFVLIDFWASWCVPCRAENPNVIAAYNKFRFKGFTVISISLDNVSTKVNWLKAIKEDHLDWTNLSDLNGFKSDVIQRYFIKAIPQDFLIGPDGKIIAKSLRGDDLQKKLDELIK